MVFVVLVAVTRLCAAEKLKPIGFKYVFRNEINAHELVFYPIAMIFWERRIFAKVNKRQ